MPEKAGLRLSYGDTMRRAVPQTGRNEPCHCGSGRKYKHCCLEKDNERLRSATDIAGVTRQELRTAPEVHYTPERLDVAHRFEVLAIDPQRLPPALIETMADASLPIRQIAADAYEAIRAIASTAIEKIQHSGTPQK